MYMILIMINLFKLNEWVMTSDFRQLEIKVGKIL